MPKRGIYSSGKERVLYCIGEIDEGGYIYDAARTMVHRETIFPLRRPECKPLYETLGAAKEALPELSEYGNPPLILAVENGSGVQALWVRPEQEEVIQTRLRTWSGCYGAWKVRKLDRKAA